MRRIELAVIRLALLLGFAFFLFSPSVQAQEKVPGIAGLVYGSVRGSCAPWDGAATEIILTPVQKQCGDVEQGFPYIRISVNNRSLENLGPGVYQIDSRENMANQASFVYGDKKFFYANKAVLTVKTRNEATQKISGEFQLTFEDQHVETVSFEAVICGGSQQLCG